VKQWTKGKRIRTSITESGLATMLAEGIITKEELEMARRYLVDKLEPIIGSLEPVNEV